MTEVDVVEAWGSADDLTALFGAIQNLDSVDWPDEDWDGSSIRLRTLLARVAIAVGPRTPVYAHGKVDLTSEPYQVTAHVFTETTVVSISGDATAPKVDVRPNRPASISVTNAKATSHPRKPGHLEYTVDYRWGFVTISEKNRWPFGDAAALLAVLQSRLGKE